MVLQPPAVMSYHTGIEEVCFCICLQMLLYLLFLISDNVVHYYETHLYHKIIYITVHSTNPCFFYQQPLVY